MVNPTSRLLRPRCARTCNSRRFLSSSRTAPFCSWKKSRMMVRIRFSTSSRSNVERIAWLASYKMAIFCIDSSKRTILRLKVDDGSRRNESASRRGWSAYLDYLILRRNFNPEPCRAKVLLALYLQIFSHFRGTPQSPLLPMEFTEFLLAFLKKLLPQSAGQLIASAGRPALSRRQHGSNGRAMGAFWRPLHTWHRRHCGRKSARRPRYAARQCTAPRQNPF